MAAGITTFGVLIWTAAMLAGIVVGGLAIVGLLLKHTVYAGAGTGLVRLAMSYRKGKGMSKKG